MIHYLPKQKISRISSLFEKTKETLVWSCLQGHMGNAWANCIESPTCAQVITGDFCFYAGDSQADEARLLVKNIPSLYNKDWILMVPSNESWATLIEEEYENKFKKYYRYAIKKETNNFNINKLQAYIDNLSEEYDLVPIDEHLYNISVKEEWSYDFCSQFLSFDDYKKRGVGFAILHLGKLVCGASSYTVYDEGIEIEIGTREGYRQKGLATVCASKLIIECIKRGIYPSWDAANKESLSLAQKLGYNFDNEYITYEVDCTKV